jgi:glycosyltransferase involved in cell wall biosynthesis
LWEEPFSVVLLEGMALGLPVVAANTGGTPEAVRNGENGFLFAPGQVEDLTTVLNRLEEDRPMCERVGACARQSVLEHFTIERMVDRLLGEGPTPIG